MNKQKSTGLAALCAAFALSCPPAFAVETTLPTPPPSAFADTESSTNIPFAGWNDLTRFMNIRAEVFASLASCVQVAFGTDHNDGDLTIDETDLVLGYDCGTWFIRDEKETRLTKPTRPAKETRHSCRVNMILYTRQECRVSFVRHPSPRNRPPTASNERPSMSVVSSRTTGT